MGKELDKTYIMTCEDCRKLTQEMINADRAYFLKEVNKSIAANLKIDLDVKKDVGIIKSWLWIYGISLILIFTVLFYLIFEK